MKKSSEKMPFGENRVLYTVPVLDIYGRNGGGSFFFRPERDIAEVRGNGSVFAETPEEAERLRSEPEERYAVWKRRNI